jgi:hypothetical protein
VSLERFVSDGQRTLGTYALGAAMLAAPLGASYTFTAPSYRINSHASYSLAPSIYVTWLTQAPSYAPLSNGVLGLTTPHNGWNAIDERLSPQWRFIVAVHENTHNMRYVLGVDRGLSPSQAENANRDMTEAILGPELAVLHARLGRVRE